MAKRRLSSREIQQRRDASRKALDYARQRASEWSADEGMHREFAQEYDEAYERFLIDFDEDDRNRASVRQLVKGLGMDLEWVLEWNLHDVGLENDAREFLIAEWTRLRKLGKTRKQIESIMERRARVIQKERGMEVTGNPMDQIYVKYKPGIIETTKRRKRDNVHRRYAVRTTPMRITRYSIERERRARRLA